MEDSVKLSDIDKETEDVFKKWYKCIVYPERKSCIGCRDEFSCVFYREDWEVK